jgi:single-strand DNA-binding protein
MNQLNSILIEGNLTKDPTFKETTKGTPLCTFAVASNRYYKSGSEMENEVSYFDVETWSKLADTCGKQLKKGRGVRVVGRLKQERWKATDGTARSSVKIVAEHVEFKPEVKNKAEGRQEKEEEETAELTEEALVF